MNKNIFWLYFVVIVPLFLGMSGMYLFSQLWQLGAAFFTGGSI
jgi:hypothetical protein